MTKIGIQISSLKPYLQTEKDVYETFRRLGEMGCQMVQLQWINPSIPAEIISDALKQAKLYTVSTQDYYQEVTAHLDETIRLNELCCSSHICVSGIPAEYRSYDGCIAFAGELNALSRNLEEKEMVLSFHPRKQEFDLFNGIPGVELIMSHTRSEVCLGLDLYHVQKAGLDSAEWIRRYASRIDFVHFKDYVRLPDGNEKLVPVGQGDIDWQPVIKACLEKNIPWAFAEQETWDRDAFICMQESFHWLVGQGFCP
ncbi:MAG: sugar phosphate isomerase/epimerase [Oscillospiraceae bacterium]|nr:sugar phosphate isomerase/epimerase [Oscillospiraceae bacterium]